MLIKTPAQPNDTVSLKLISGEEVIGRLIESTESDVTIRKPMAFLMGPQGLGLVPFMFSATETDQISIKVNAVVSMAKTDENVSKQYIKQSTGLLT